MKRVPAGVVLVASLLLAAACSSTARPHAAPSAPAVAPTGTATAAPARPRGTAVPAYYRQRLSWSGCGGGFQCAVLRVPLDYAHPSRMISVSVIRLPASSGRRIGSLLVNPGGPGASGVDYARYAQEIFPADVRARFDIVGFDPRGVGRSTPVRCLSYAELDRFVALDPVPDTPAEKQALIDGSRAFAQGCERRSGWLLSHVSSLDAARDMDVLRAALGDARLTYLGQSYGTFLGAKYAQLFPRRIRAMVLDGAVDPAASTLDEDRIQAIGFERDLQDFVSGCVSGGGCPLGDSYSGAQSALDRLLERVDLHPLPGGNGRTAGAGEAFTGLASALYVPSVGWRDLRTAISSAQSGWGGPLLALSDELTERQSNGSYTNLMEAEYAVDCTDRGAPRDLASYDRQAAQLQRLAPHFGVAIAYGSLPCAFWPVPPVDHTEPVHDPGAPPVLVIGTTRDPATPYVWAQGLAHELHARLLTFDGDGHTAYDRGDSCIYTNVDSYLVSGALPSTGTVCR